MHWILLYTYITKNSSTKKELSITVLSTHISKGLSDQRLSNVSGFTIFPTIFGFYNMLL